MASFLGPGEPTPPPAPWRWLVVIDDGRDISFVPHTAVSWLRAARNALKASRMRRTWRLLQAYPWPPEARSPEEAARAWAMEHRESLVPILPSNRTI